MFQRMMVDEADIDLVGGSSGGSSPIRGQKRMLDSPIGSPKAKRKPGPLPKDFPVWRPQSPSPNSPTLNNVAPESHIIPITTSNDSDDDIYIIEKERHATPLSKLLLLGLPSCILFVNRNILLYTFLFTLLCLYNVTLNIYDHVKFFCSDIQYRV